MLIMLIAFGMPLPGQKIWSEVSLNKPSVYVGEPVEVKISVYTSTWFTSGIDLGNIKVEGAFTVYFRPVSTSFSRNGQTYAGVELIYNVFPFSEQDLIFPSLEITVESPPEGDYKGIRKVIRSEEKPIRVMPVPGGFDPDEWLVTTNLSVSDNWQGDLQNVKVGDVLVREIIRTARGSVSELIPPIQWDSIAGVGLYKARSNSENIQSRTGISATLTETMRYFFEKEGTVSIPQMVFSWYDPVQKKAFKRTRQELSIEVMPNPDLGVLATVRDSLQLEQDQTIQASGENGPFKILGLTPEQLALVVLLGGIVIYVLILLARRSIRLWQLRKEQYRNSEAFYFSEFMKAAKTKDARRTINALYRWIDALHLAEPTLEYFEKSYGNEDLTIDILNLTEESKGKRSAFRLDPRAWHIARQKYRQGPGKPGPGTSSPWINP